MIVANPAMIDAYRAGVPDNGKPFPDGSKIAKIAWNPKQYPDAPFSVKVPDTLSGIGFMVKDSNRFADTGGWGYAQFDYDPASDTFTPNTSLQGNDAKCGSACHTHSGGKRLHFHGVWEEVSGGTGLHPCRLLSDAGGPLIQVRTWGATSPCELRKPLTLIGADYPRWDRATSHYKLLDGLRVGATLSSGGLGEGALPIRLRPRLRTH